ncbi:MAG: ABC transporter permease [Muribaculaceae bacterium]|nr:ABC transporter permease [Muribaculaceae bacterium]
MNRFVIDIKEWLLETARIFRHEMTLVFSDIGVMLFFFFLPIAYPIVYSLIYNTEVTRDMPVAVVDHARTALSREFVRHADATEAMKICGYAADLNEARDWMAAKKCFAIIEIPEDYSRKLGRAEQPQVQFYCEMSLLLRYRTFSSSLADLQIATGADLRERALDDLGMPSNGAPSNIESYGFALGDTQQGFASFIIPGIVVLILQQSMLLGIVLLGGTRAEQRRRLRGGGVTVFGDDASPSAQILGRALCYTIIYIPLAIYILHYIPLFFHYPHEGKVIEYVLFIFPMLLASAMLGQTLNIMATERESAFIIVVFTSVAFLFLSGLTWPVYAMNRFLGWISDMIPCTWGLQGFVHINSNDAVMGQQSHPFAWLWGLTVFYTLTAYLVTRWQTRRG